MSTIRSTFRHASVYTMAAVLGKLISFFMLPFYAHILQDVGYGVIGMIDTTLAFLMGLLAYGARGGIVRLYHEHPEGRKNEVVSTGFLLVGMTVFALVGLLLPFSGLISRGLLGDSKYAILLVMALVGFALELTGQAASSILLIQRRSLFYSGVGMLRLFVGLGLNIWLVVILRWDLYGYFLSSLLTSLISNVIFIVAALRICGRRFDHGTARELIRFQLPLIPGNLASFVSRQVERILVRYQIDLASLGVLEMGYKFPVLISLLVTQPFMRSWNTTRTEIADEPGAPRQIGQMFSFFLALVVFGGLLIAVNIKTVLHLLTPPEFWPAYRIARIDVLALILTGCYYHVSFGLYYAKDTATMSKLRAATSVVKVLLSYLFIRFWGLYGAAWSAFITALILATAGGVLAQRRYRIELEWRKIAAVVGWAVVLFLLLTRTDLRVLGAWRWLDGTALPQLVDILSRTPVGSWKDGKVMALLSERSALTADLVLQVLFCFGYLAIVPALHSETRRRLLRRIGLG